MKLTYKLNKDIVARTAAMLSWDLNQLHSSIHIQSEDRVINGKSLVGLLSAQLRMGDTINIVFDEVNDFNKIKEIFNELGGEV